MSIVDHQSVECPKEEAMDDLSSSASSAGSYRHIQNNTRRMPKVFDFHSGRKCPTCEGTGKIPRDREDELLALIPYKDKRLSPKKPWLAICLICFIVLIIVMLIVGVTLAVLMYPREVTVSLTNLTETNSYITFKRQSTNISNVTIELLTSIVINNKNYFPIQINYVTLQFDYIDVIVGNHSESNFTSIPSSTFKKYSIIQNATFPNSKGKRLLNLCTSRSFPGFIHLDISVSISYTYLSHRSNVMDSYSNFFTCQIQIPIHNMTTPTGSSNTESTRLSLK